jgi:lactate dehydrogenase-like 2-hydroxyacid dehydrogenase
MDGSVIGMSQWSGPRRGACPHPGFHQGSKGRTNASPPATVGVAASKAELFAVCDGLSLQVRLKPDTRGIVGPENLALMKPTALIINTARPELITRPAPG